MFFVKFYLSTMDSYQCGILVPTFGPEIYIYYIYNLKLMIIIIIMQNNNSCIVQDGNEVSFNCKKNHYSAQLLLWYASTGVM